MTVLTPVDDTQETHQPHQQNVFQIFLFHFEVQSALEVRNQRGKIQISQVIRHISIAMTERSNERLVNAAVDYIKV